MINCPFLNQSKTFFNLKTKIVSLLNDLQTLTDMDVKDYTIEVDNEQYDADVDVLKQVLILLKLYIPQV